MFLKKFGDILNWGYIFSEIKKLGIGSFEEKNRNLAIKIFKKGDTDKLSAEEKELLRYFVNSGTYGVQQHVISNSINKKGRFKYILRRIFLGKKEIEEYYPFFYKHKLLLPILPFYRLIVRNKSAKEEIRTVLKYSKSGNNILD